MCIRKSFFSVWCRRTDELVDGPNAGYMSPAVLDRREERLQDIFYGRPYDMHDAALADTVFKFPLDIKVHVCLLILLRIACNKTNLSLILVSLI